MRACPLISVELLHQDFLARQFVFATTGMRSMFDQENFAMSKSVIAFGLGREEASNLQAFHNPCVAKHSRQSSHLMTSETSQDDPLRNQKTIDSQENSTVTNFTHKS